LLQRDLFSATRALRMGENDFRESTHNSQADQAGLETNYTARHKDSGCA